MFLKKEDIEKIGFKKVGDNVLISDKAVFYYPELIEIGNNVRIDDFCILSGKIIFHDYIHIGAYSHILSGRNSVIEFNDFSAMSFNSTVFTKTDDYLGEYICSPMVPDKYRRITEKSVIFGRHANIGAGTIVFPGADISEGVAVGAMSLIVRKTKAWKIYSGNPAKAVCGREKNILQLEENFRKSNNG